MAGSERKSSNELQAELARLRQRVADLERRAAAMQSAVPATQVLLATAIGVSSASGDEFFRLLARHLADSLDCEYAEVGVVIGRTPTHIRTLALISHGQLLDNIEYDLTGTPCNNVVNREVCIYPQRVQEHFPSDHYLTDWQVEAYAGTPLVGSGGAVLGLMCVMSKRPFADPAAVGAALQIYAVRAAAELERQQSLASLQASEERFRQIAENSRDVFWLYDIQQLRLVYLSPAFETIWQRPVSWLYDDPSRWIEAVDEDDRQLALPFERPERPGLSYDRTYRIHRPDGSVRWLHDRRFAVFNESGELYRIAGVAEDVTERWEATEKLQQQAAQLARMARLSSMGELVAGISHEVNQPLHVITVLSTTIAAALAGEGKWTPADLTRWNSEISKAAGRAADIVRRLRSYVSQTPTPRSLVDLNSLVQESVELAGLERRQHRAKLRLELADDLPLVEADAIGIQQVLVNLLRNAMEAMDNQPVTQRIVTVRTAATSEGVEATVSDAGLGLSQQSREQLFSAFYTSKPGGMGIGLAICKTIVEAHGGRIWATPNAERGATFGFVLPVAQGERDA
jgi:signal transduction histidine kinase